MIGKKGLSRIICTLGPSCNTKEVLISMIDKGMDIARVNCSHGNDTSLREVFELVNTVRDQDKYCTLSLAIDTKGPEIRTGIAKGKIQLEKDSILILTTNQKYLNECTSSRVYIDYNRVFEDLEKNSNVKYIYIDDGKIKLEILKVSKSEEEIQCKVIIPGDLSSRKGVNIPGATILIPSLTDNDVKNIQLGIEYGADYIFVSFVRGKEDILAVKKIPGTENTKIIAKIESVSALDNLEEIIDISDGIMVARGDLGIEVDQSLIFALECQIAYQCKERHKPFIIATQMLESMTHSLKPTRAEIIDVGLATALGAGCVMLSGESATGINPPNCIETMNKILISSSEHLLKANLSLTVASNEKKAENKQICPTPNKNTILKGAIAQCTNTNCSSDQCQNKVIIIVSNDKKYLRTVNHVYKHYPVYCLPEEDPILPEVPLGYYITTIDHFV
ncbi:pyruvate kinase [Nematocida sp. AWRm80]|nr:pyruvate kinase [Nematocida sp. AWRm80]